MLYKSKVLLFVWDFISRRFTSHYWEPLSPMWGYLGQLNVKGSGNKVGLWIYQGVKPSWKFQGSCKWPSGRRFFCPYGILPATVTWHPGIFITKFRCPITLTGQVNFLPISNFFFRAVDSYGECICKMESVMRSNWSAKTKFCRSPIICDHRSNASNTNMRHWRHNNHRMKHSTFSSRVHWHFPHSFCYRYVQAYR